NILHYGHLVKGVIAQFFYVGAQIGVASFIIRLAQHSNLGLLQKDASFYLKLHLIGFMIGRFSGSYIMKRVPAARLLSLFALSTLICLLVVLLGSGVASLDRKSTRLNSSHVSISYAVFCLKKKTIVPYIHQLS